MHKAHDQKEDPAGTIQQIQMETAVYKHIGQERSDGGEELPDRAMQPRDGMDRLVEQDDRGIQRCCAEAIGDARQARAGGVAHADDQQQAERGHEEAHDLLFRHPLFEEQRGENRDDDRRKVIAQRRDGNRRVLIGLKQQNPVEAHCHAGKEQAQKLAFAGADAQLLARRGQIDQEKTCGQRGAAERELAGGDGDMAGKQADRAEDRHGQDHVQLVGGFHRAYSFAELITSIFYHRILQPAIIY